jgi:hypothetical protein
MKTALARRNEWARQLRLMQEERKRRKIESELEPELKFKNIKDKNVVHLDNKTESDSD